MCEPGVMMCAGTVGFNEQFQKENKNNTLILSVNVKVPSEMQFLYWPLDASALISQTVLNAVYSPLNVCLGSTSERYCSPEVISNQCYFFFFFYHRRASERAVNKPYKFN